MDTLDEKLIENFDGKVVRKDLLHRIKKGRMSLRLYWNFF